MRTEFDLVTLDSPDPDALAAFWSAALDLVESEREDGNRWIVLAERTGARRLGIQRGVHRPGSVHLDLRCTVEDHAAETARLVRLGARAVGSPGHRPTAQSPMLGSMNWLV
jgi:hypothetical protein